MKAFITGGAGFIGSTMVDRLLAQGHAVTAYDDFSTGRRDFLVDAHKHGKFRLVEGDLLDSATLDLAMAGHDVVFHFAANADVRDGLKHPRRDLEQNTIATSNVLEAMRAHGIARLAFSSTGSIYGEPEVFPTPETCPFPIQTSLYGASKLACEGLVSAYATGYGFDAWVFRFVSILGERYTHGHVFDFYKKLRADRSTLPILGDGKQRKSYLYVQDCVDAILTAMVKTPRGYHVYNLGTDEYVNVDDSIDVITKYLGIAPKRVYSGGERGWIGDSPFIFLDTKKIRGLGWAPRLDIRQAVEKTIGWLVQNPHVLERG
jgi:UDP-glucose 4-epimerase